MMFWNKTRKIQLIELFYESKKGLYKEIRKKKKIKKIFQREFLRELQIFSINIFK